ncbi:DUF6671 family protein [Thermomonas flagellata]|uniref:DUF6671 family protein n=1 Tax=Thermomonas flagellata TaxID=2888524 RepID=UPI001F046045|nr:DUF6671 family protein [Thermomonas flagellata]
MAVVATRHGKARALRVPLRRLAGVRLRTPRDLATDALGTFCGSQPRTRSALETVRAKARLAIAASGIPRALASEGSFGGDPTCGLLALHQELLLWRDEARGIELLESCTRPVRHHAVQEVADLAQARSFARRHGFPAHALCVQPAGLAGGAWPNWKGVRDPALLAFAVESCIATSPQRRARLLLDLRAHCHPERMRVLAGLGARLARRLATPCPECASPGWGVHDRRTGLPCAWCGTATAQVAAWIEGCVACGLRRERPRADGLRAADPGDCPQCNP